MICSEEHIGTDSVSPGSAPYDSTVDFTYTDAQGNPIYRLKKQPSKQFYFERYSHGQWLPGLEGISRTLYNVPALLDAKEVFLLEGEKDCETVQRLGLVATTMGSKNSWKRDFAAFFKGKNVHVCLDVGNEADAERIAEDIEAVADTVRILKLPGLDKKEQDITDWLEQMGDASVEEKKKRLLDVVKKTPAIRPAPDKQVAKRGARAMTLTEFMKKDIPPRDIFMACWVEREHLTILGGRQKVGKSILAVNLGLSVANGTDFLGFKVPQPRRVLYVQQEIAEPAMLDRLRIMVSGLGPSYADNFMIENTTGTPLKLTSQADRQRLSDLLDHNKPDLLILDPFSTFHNKDENSAPEMTAVLEPIFELKYKFKVGILLIHHFGKPSLAERKGSQRLRGSSVIGDRADALIMLDELPTMPQSANPALPGEFYAEISFDLRNDASPSPITVVRESATLWYRRASQKVLPSKKLPKEKIVEVVRDHSGQIRQSELEALLKGKVCRGTVRRAIDDALKAGLIVPENLPMRGSPVLLKLSEKLS